MRWKKRKRGKRPILEILDSSRLLLLGPEKKQGAKEVAEPLLTCEGVGFTKGTKVGQGPKIRA